MLPESSTRPFRSLLERDLIRACRNPGEISLPILFFIVTTSLFPLALGSDPELLGNMAPGIIWVVALLATLLSLSSMFREEFDNGTLVRIALCPHPLPLLVMAKVLSHWLISGLPLTLVAVLLGYMLNLPGEAYLAMLASLVLGTPSLSVIGAIGAALTVGLRKGNLLLTLIIMPLYVPVLIFGASIIQSAAQDLPWAGQLYLLGAILVLGITLAPFVIANAIKINLN